MWKKAYFEVLSLHLPGGTEENHKETGVTIVVPRYSNLKIRKYQVASQWRATFRLNCIYLFVVYLTLILLTWTKWRAPTNASKWRMGFNPYPANVNNMASSYQC